MIAGAPHALDTPPAGAPDAERQVIGSILMDPSRLDTVAGIVQPDDWTDYRCGLAWRLLTTLRAAGTPIDSTMLVETARADGKLADLGGVNQVGEWLHAVATAANAAHYASIVRDRGARRELYYACHAAASDAHDGVATPDIIARLGGRLAYLGATAGERSSDAMPVMVSMADVQPEDVAWLWEQRIALGKITILAGNPGLGKSFVSLAIAATVSRGARWPDCDVHAPLGSVIIMGAEDGLGDTMRPRLDAAGADVTRIHAMTAIRVATRDDEPRELSLDLGRDIEAIERGIASLRDCRLVIIDPISAYMGARLDSHSNTDVRGVLAPLAAMAERQGVAVLAISHLNKAAASPAAYRTIGSIAFSAAARCVLAVARDPSDEDGRRRLVVPIKNNLGNDSTGLAYTLTAAHTGGVPVVEWSSEPVEMSADEALAPPERRRGPAPEERDEATDWLADALADGPRLAREMFAEAKDADISETTLKRAKKTLGIVAYRDKVPGPWWWSLQGGQVAEPLASDGPCLELLGSLDPLGETRGNFDIFDESSPKESKGVKLFVTGPLGDETDADDSAGEV